MLTGNEGRPPEGKAYFHFAIVVVTALETGTGALARKPLFFGYPLAWVASRQGPASVSPKGNVTLHPVEGCRSARILDECRMKKIGFTPAVELEQDAVDVGQLDGLGFVADGLQELSLIPAAAYSRGSLKSGKNLFPRRSQFFMESQKKRQRRGMLSCLYFLHVSRGYIQAFGQGILTYTHRTAQSGDILT